MEELKNLINNNPLNIELTKNKALVEELARLDDIKLKNDIQIAINNLENF